MHFQIIDASEGEHGNIKAADNAKREFVLHTAQPVALNDANELIVNFEYRVLSSQDALTKEQEDAVKKEFGASNKGDLANLYIARQILAAGKALDNLPADYLTLLSTPAPTDKIKQRPLLAKYINQNTRRNTMDYFIHKDLGRFLRRELDFYIKNEVMRLDDIENADAPAVESYLSKIKVLRQIAHKLIDFLAQLEDFQKKLWLKKKFVTETNYCITLDRVPVELYPEICANQAQLTEWIQLFAIDEIKGDLTTPAFSNPLTLEFLQANTNLVLDTQFFSEQFKAQLLASIEDFDEQCDGLLIHSENSQAIRLFRAIYSQKVKLIYLDPPYNTGNDGFLYKDNYNSSSWLGMMAERLILAKELLSHDGAIVVQISDHEHAKLCLILDAIFESNNFVNKITLKTRSPSGFQVVNKGVYETAEYLYIYAKNKPDINPLSIYEPCSHDDNYKYIVLNPKERPENWEWKLTTEYLASEKGYESARSARKELSKNVFDKVVEEFSINNANRIFRLASISNTGASKETVEYKNKSLLSKDKVFVHQRVGHADRLILNGQELTLYSNKVKLVDGKLVPTMLATNIWTDIAWEGIASEGGVTLPKGKKPEKLLDRLIDIYTDPGDLVLDFFGGTGTTAAVAHQKQRRFISVEQDSKNFNSMVFRVTKFASQQKNFKLNYAKYIRLESYEDTLNNLRLASDPVRQRAIDANSQLKQDYMLHYMLDVETRGSQSLLNIDAFADPTAYTLEVKKPGSDESVERTIDLIETFNYLIGLRVEHTAAPQGFNAKFNRVQDAHARQGQTTRLVLDGRLQQDDNGPWGLRKIEGWLPADPANPNNGARDKVLIVWRKLTGDLEQDNLVLDEWFKTHRINSRDFEYATIYVNGSNNLPNLKKAEDRWKVRLIEEEFMQRMWDVEG